MKEKLELYLKENLETHIGFKKARYVLEDSCLGRATLEDLDYETSANIDEYIDKNKDDNKFQKLLFKYIDERDLKDSEVYNKVHVDRRLFSKIRSDSNYHPSKETVILLGIALELSEEEIEELLESAAYSLPKNNPYDLIIRFCFIQGIYDVNVINEFLDDHECKLLGVN
jgi:hypothetical protein